MTLEEAIAQYRHGLAKYCYSLLGNFHDAQDATQETFAKAFAKRDTFRGAASAVTWLYRIAHNTCLSMLRRRRFAFFAPTRPPDPVPNTDLARALATLSPKERALLYARAVEDIDYDALAIIHNARAATLRKRYERIRKKMQKLLQE